MLLVKEHNKYIKDAKQFLCENVYGEIPAKPVHLSADVGEKDEFFAADKAVLKKHNLICELEGGRTIQFPITAIIPKNRNNLPAIISAEHNGAVPNKFLPIEEIIDRGYAVFCFNHNDITENSKNFKEKLYQSLSTRKKKNAPGKIAIWAYAMIRIAEYISDFDFIDKSKIIASGHSFLGKSALLAAAFCDKFSYAIANDSMGFGSLSPLSNPMMSYPYMFCPKLCENDNLDDIKTEHYSLLLACSDKRVLVGVSEDDLRSLPDAELECLKRVKAENSDFEYHFHERQGSQYLSRQDWNTYLDFIDKNSSFDNFILQNQSNL